MTDLSLSDTPTLPGIRLLRQIGRGNTSRVFSGTLEGKPGQYAIKIPTPSTLAEHAAAERFANEVRLSMQFNHPNLVRGVSGVGFGPQAHLVMPQYQEGTLADQQEKGRTFSTPELLAILRDIAAGMSYLHAQDGVHQDIKPQNVYLTEGKAALGDFGSTYLAGGKRSVSGSPFYMSPEIYHGEGSSAASDVYSFGVMCYELFAGKRPYKGSSYEELMVAHLTQFPAPLGPQNAEVPKTLARLIEQCMGKKVSERPQAQALQKAFEQAIQEIRGEAVSDALVSTAAPVQGAAVVGRGGSAAPSVAPTPAPASAPKQTKKKGFWARLFGR